MAKARRVRGIRPKAPLRDNARRIIATRLAELLAWRTALDDATAIRDLHDLRIAAKRLRYALEIFDICFANVKDHLNDLTNLQESVGDIHDLDVLIDIVRTRLHALDQVAESAAVSIMASHAPLAEKNNRLRQVLYAQARDRRRLGLLGLLAGYIAQRHEDFEILQTRWGGEALDEFAGRVQSSIAPQPEPLPGPAPESVDSLGAKTGLTLESAGAVAEVTDTHPEPPAEPWWSSGQ